MNLLAFLYASGDIDEIGQSKEKKPILIAGAAQPAAGEASFEASSAGFTLTATVDDVTSDTFHTPPDTLVEGESGGLTLTATVDDVSGSAFSTGPDVSGGGFTMTSSVDEVTSSVALPVESSPILVVGDAGMSTSVHSAEVEAISAAAVSPVLMAEPYLDSTVIAEHPDRLTPSKRSNKGSSSPQGPQISTTLSPTSPIQNGVGRIQSPHNGPKVPQQVSPKPQVFSPQPTPQAPNPQPQALSPKPQVFSPQPQAFSPKPQVFSPQPQAFSPQPQAFSPKPQVFSPQPQAYSPQPQVYSPQPATARSPLQAWSPNRPATSPKPQAPPVSPKPVLVPTPVISRSMNTDSHDGVTSSVSTSTFDDGNTRREVSHQVQRFGDSRNNTTTTVRRETTTTAITNKTAQPFSASISNTSNGKISNQTSAFNVVQPTANGTAGPRRNFSSTTSNTTIKTLSTRGGPQQQFSTTISSSRSTSDIPTATSAPLFKPSRFVPGGERKDPPGLYGPGSPMVDAEGNMVFGKENLAPNFQVGVTIFGFLLSKFKCPLAHLSFS